MAKLSNEIVAVVEIGKEEVTLHLRRPTNKELSTFMGGRYEAKRGKMKDNSFQSRIDFFDKLITKVENLEDDEGVITVDRKDAIPSNWKSDIIFKEFEDNDIDLKN